MQFAPLRRDPVAEYGLPFEMKASLGTEFRAVWDTPQLSGLMEQELKLKNLAEGVFTEDQTARMQSLGDDFLSIQTTLGEKMSTATSKEEKDIIWEEYQEERRKHNERLEEVKRESIDEGRLLEVETLRATYGDLLEFDERMSAAEAAELYRIKSAERIRNEVLARTPGGFWRTAGKLGVGLLDIVTDPAEAAVALGTAWLFPWTGGTAGRRILIGGAEAFTGAAIAETGVYGLSRRQQLDYTAGEAVINTLLGTVMGAGISGAIGPRGVFTPDELIRLRAREGVAFSPRNADLAQTAIRLLVNDEPVILNPFWRDRRGGVAISRVEGLRVQSPLETERLNVAPTTVRATDDTGALLEFTDRAAAIERAELTGGAVEEHLRPYRGLMFTVREPVEGEFVRTPDGNPLFFPSRQDADDWLSLARGKLEAALPRAGAENLRVVDVPGRGSAVTYGMDESAVRAIERGDAEISKGVDMNEMSYETPDDRVLTGDAAAEAIARDYAGSTGEPTTSNTLIDGARAAPEDAEVRSAEEQIEGIMETLSKEDRAALDPALTKIDDDADAAFGALKQTAACLLRNIV